MTGDVGYTRGMVSTIVANDPQRGAQNLLVEVHPGLGEVPSSVIGAFTRRLFEGFTRVGLVVTPVKTLVVRDTLSSMGFADNHYDVRDLETGLLFEAARLGAPKQDEFFVLQVMQLLEAIGESWYTNLHPSAVEAMVPDVIGNLVDTELERIETPDAAE